MKKSITGTYPKWSIKTTINPKILISFRNKTTMSMVKQPTSTQTIQKQRSTHRYSTKNHGINSLNPRSTSRTNQIVKILLPKSIQVQKRNILLLFFMIKSMQKPLKTCLSPDSLNFSNQLPNIESLPSITILINYHIWRDSKLNTKRTVNLITLSNRKNIGLPLKFMTEWGIWISKTSGDSIKPNLKRCWVKQKPIFKSIRNLRLTKSRTNTIKNCKNSKDKRTTAFLMTLSDFQTQRKGKSVRKELNLLKIDIILFFSFFIRS